MTNQQAKFRKSYVFEIVKFSLGLLYDLPLYCMAFNGVASHGVLDIVKYFCWGTYASKTKMIFFKSDFCLAMFKADTLLPVIWHNGSKDLDSMQLTLPFDRTFWIMLGARLYLFEILRNRLLTCLAVSMVCADYCNQAFGKPTARRYEDCTYILIMEISTKCHSAGRHCRRKNYTVHSCVHTQVTKN